MRATKKDRKLSMIGCNSHRFDVKNKPMYKNGEVKRVLLIDVDKYIKDGWLFGFKTAIQHIKKCEICGMEFSTPNKRKKLCGKNCKCGTYNIGITNKSYSPVAQR